MDVDGTLTDGKIYLGNDGELFKAFDIKDGYGIREILTSFGIKPVIITGRISEILIQRCHELNIIDIFQGIDSKEETLKSYLSESGYTFKNVAYIGDDMNDFACMQLIKSNGGIIGCPYDAVEQVVNISDFVSDKHGGNGAVRDFIEWIVALNS